MHSSALWAVIIAIVVIVHITIIVRAIQKRLRIYREVRSRLGFVELKNPDSDLREKVAPILDTEPGKVHIKRLYKRDSGRDTLYNCQVSRGNNSDGEGLSFIIVMSDVNLPPFRMIPCLFSSGMFGGLIRRATQMAARTGGYQQVDLAGMPDVAEKYVLAAKEPHRLLAEYPSAIWRELMAISEHLFVKAGGDTVIFSVLDFVKRRRQKDFEKSETETLRQAIDIASRLSGIFSTSDRTAAYAGWR